MLAEASGQKYAITRGRESLISLVSQSDPTLPHLREFPILIVG
jgi:hypothetical protein